jgi:hypothetical protein
MNEIKKISIRNSKYAKIGLIDLINYINKNSPIKTLEMTMVEIGSYVGDSTEIFSKSFKHVISIDPYENGYDNNDASSYTIAMVEVEKQFLELCKICPNITKLKMTSEEGAHFFVEDHIFDFVYVDGNHKDKFVEQDTKLWLPKIKRKGWIGGHDYNNKNAPEVKNAVDKILGSPDRLFLDTSWIKRRS